MYTVSTLSTATAGVDYVALSGTAIIPAGQSTVDVVVTPLMDGLIEPSESLRIDIVDTAFYTIGTTMSATSATMTILDSPPPTVSITASDATASERATTPDTARFRISRNSTSPQPLTVAYLIFGTAQNGVDYNLLSGQAVIPANLSYVDINLTSVADSIRGEGNETVTLTLTPLDGSFYAISTAPASQSATATIRDSNTVSVEAVDRIATRPAAGGTATDFAVFRISRDGPTTSALQIFFTLGGTATNGIDYVALTLSVTIPIGASYVDVRIVPRADAAELNDVVTINPSPAQPKR